MLQSRKSRTNCAKNKLEDVMAKRKRGELTVSGLAVLITELEGKKVQVNIAQVKEILKVLAVILRYEPKAAVAFLKYVLKS